MSQNVHSQMPLFYLQMFHAVFPVADGEDEVDDGGELFKQKMMTCKHKCALTTHLDDNIIDSYTL